MNTQAQCTFSSVSAIYNKFTAHDTGSVVLHVKVSCLRSPGEGLHACLLVVKIVELEGLTEMRKTDCSGKTRLVPHVPSSP